MANLTTPMSKEDKMTLIKENLQEILNEEIITKVLEEGRNPKIYWGEFGYFISFTRLEQLARHQSGRC